jgi:hypothetical protein
MSLFLQMKTIKDKVEFLMKRTPRLKDNDFKLTATFWWHEMGKEKTQLMTGYDFLEVFSQGKLTHPESIRRVRQKLQEENPELRGASYKRRKDDGDDTTKNIKGL